ncbi:hypothetical protein BBW65_01360 [Helicobacter enhydrae]|uniref:Integral membrane protein n=1 Tax=Helicobacter enhydrae TaxID=222136 RepID=A0A1B1U434_9HELI|nr:hypothetical protein [Helicobacter enhydrae]ANV97537.1 hypothetical protein BBW65_01360 [Helicobacter enhydrae]
MKSLLKVLCALAIAASWYLFSGQGSESTSIAFFFIVLFALFVKPVQPNQSRIKKQYLEKLREGVERNQEIKKRYTKERNVVYKDFRKKD